MATMRVQAWPQRVATFVITRNDGHELSLSGDRNSLIEFNGREIVTDHSAVFDPMRFAAILGEFLKAETEDETANVYSRHTHRSA